LDLKFLLSATESPHKWSSTSASVGDHFKIARSTIFWS